MTAHKIVEKEDGYRVSVVDDIVDAEKLRSSWEELANTPFGFVDYYLYSFRSGGNGCRPYIAVVYRGGIPQLILAGILQEIQFEVKVGYFTLKQTTVRALKVDYGALIGVQTPETCGILITHLITYLERREVDIILCRWVPTKSEFYQIARGKTPFSQRDHFPVITKRMGMTLPGSVEEYYKIRSRNFRKQMKRKFRILNESFKGEISIRFFRDKDEVDELLAHAEMISTKTYQHAFGAGILNDDKSKLLFRSLAEKGALLAAILYIAEKPAAYEIGFSSQGTIYLENSGYDPDYRKFEIGSILSNQLIEYIIDYKVAETIDLGPGEFFYKERIANYSYEETDLLIFAPGFRGFSLNVARIIAGFIHRAGDAILRKSGLRNVYNRYKRRKYVTHNGSRI